MTRDAEIAFTCLIAGHQVIRAAMLDTEGDIKAAKEVYVDAAEMMLKSRDKNVLGEQSRALL